jgi:putative hemolysin
MRRQEMRSKVSALGLVLILGALVFGGCGPAPAPPTEVPAGAPDPGAARDAALAYVREHYGEQAPALDLTWEEGFVTPEGIVGSGTYEYTAEDWVITVSYPIVAPENVVYHIVMSNGTTEFQWEGDVDAAMQVTEAAESPGLPNPASVHCEEQGYTLEIRTDANGNQYGVCIFPDGSECEEWQFFRGECTYEE